MLISHVLNGLCCNNLQAGEFVKYISGSSSLYGLQQETLSSLLMSLLPPLEHEYVDSYPEPSGKTKATDVQAVLMQKLLTALKENAGFQIPLVSMLGLNIMISNSLEYRVLMCYDTKCYNIMCYDIKYYNIKCYDIRCYDIKSIKSL